MPLKPVDGKGGGGVLGGEVLDSEGCYVDGSNWFKPRTSTSVSSNTYIHCKSQNDSTVVYIGSMCKIWGHFLTNSMSLLWFLRSSEYREHFADCPIVYVPAQNFKLKGNWKRMLEILGVKLSLLTPITETKRFERIILPDECFFANSKGIRCFTHEYVEIVDGVRDFALSHFKPDSPKKMYFSYAKVYTAKSTGEDKLERYFKSKGYEVIYPENHSLDEQLNFLAGCESFASTSGSCSHNMIFLRDNSEVILIPRANYLTGFQEALNYVHQQNIHYIDSSFSFLAGKYPWGGPFLYCISSNLRKFFGDEDTESIIDAGDFWKYVRRAFGYQFNRSFGTMMQEINENVFSYYAPVAAEYFTKLFKQSWPYRFRQFVKKLLKR